MKDQNLNTRMIALAMTFAPQQLLTQKEKSIAEQIAEGKGMDYKPVDRTRDAETIAAAEAKREKRRLRLAETIGIPALTKQQMADLRPSE